MYLLEIKIYTVIGKILGISIDEIQEDMSPETVEHWDSLLQMELFLALEEELGIQFDDEQVSELFSVGQLVQTVITMVESL